MTLPTDSKARKDIPLARGVLDYFPDALAAVAALSQAGNDKHNPGQPLHWSREKSSDHADCIMRHLIDRGTVDPEDGILHDVKVAWRALAMCQLALEKARTGAALRAAGCEAVDPPITATEVLTRQTPVVSPLVAAFHPARAFMGDADGSSSIPEFLKKHKE